MTRNLPIVFGALAFASLVGIGSAEAGHGGAHFSGHVSGGFHGSGGGAHFSGGAHVSVHYSHGGGGYHGYPTSRWSVGGHVHVGGCWGCSYGYPYYGYGYGYYPEYVPSYYGTTYYPVQAAPSYSAQVMPLARPELPRFGLGIAAGSVNTTNVDGTDQHQSNDLAFIARLRLTPGLIVEGEMGKTTYDQNARVDRRLGASLIYEIGAYNHLAPYILLGGGAQQADVGGGDFQTTQDYAEIGVGLRYAFSPHFAIAGDIRAGSRSSVSDSGTMPAQGTVLRTVTPPATNSNEAEDYTRARLAAILYF